MTKREELIALVPYLRRRAYATPGIGVVAQAEVQRLLTAVEVAAEWSLGFGPVYPDLAREHLEGAREYFRGAKELLSEATDPELHQLLEKAERLLEEADPMEELEAPHDLGEEVAP